MKRAWPTLPELQRASCAKFGGAELFGSYNVDKGRHEWTTYSEFSSLCNQAQRLLMDTGVGAGDRVAVVARNSLEWAVAAYGTYGAGGAFVPLYENQRPEDWNYILRDSGAKTVVCYTGDLARQVEKLGIRDVEVMNANQFWQELGKKDASEPPLVEVGGNALSNLIYTSGTSGKPKGVELSHGNITSNVLSIRDEFKGLYDEGHTLLSHLPWAHAYAQTVELHAGIHVGARIGIAQSVETIRRDLISIGPDILISVPSLFQRIYDGVLAQVAKTSPIKQKIFHRAVEVAKQRRAALDAGKSVGMFTAAQYAVLDKLALSKVRAALGPNARMTVSGGAALSAHVMEFFNALGLTVYEGYGLTETSPIISANTPSLRRPGTVGRPLSGVHVSIRDPLDLKNTRSQGEEGEICVSGPNVMMGYHNDPKTTNKVIFHDEEGHRTFRTEDMGRITSEGALQITGRIKEKYKLANGKYVVPTVIEAAISKSRFIAQSFVHGDNLNSNFTIVNPAWPYVAEHLGLPAETPPSELREKAQSLIESEVAEQCKSLKHFEVPRTVILATEPWTVESGLVTPKMSIKRKQMLEHYAKEIAPLK